MTTVAVTFYIENPDFVLDHYDSIRIFKADEKDGTYEFTDDTLTIESGKYEYTYTEDIEDGCDVPWYRPQLYNSSTGDESALGQPKPGEVSEDKVGWSFGNYKVPGGKWGSVLTPDDLRYTYLFGIDAKATDLAESEFSDEQFRFFIEQAVADFEDFLKIDIRRRVRKTNPDESLKRARRFEDGDYTDLEDPYPFDPQLWGHFGFVQLRKTPVIQVDRAVLQGPLQSEVLDLKGRDWIRLEKNHGQVYFYPTRGSAQFGPFQVYAMPWTLMSGRYPQGLEIDYQTGWESAEFIPDSMRGVIGQWAAIKCLDAIGDGLMAGFSSQSISLDGLSESFSSTQSATSAFFGARIKSYIDQIDKWLERNRYRWSPPRIGFVGV